MPALKICSVCGQDVSQVHRTRDAQGNYFCDACWAGRAAGGSGGVAPSSVECAVCHGRFSSKDMVQDGEQATCTVCYDARAGQTRAMAVAASKAVLRKRTESREDRTSRARASVIIAVGGIAVVGIVLALVFSGGADSAICKEMTRQLIMGDHARQAGHLAEAYRHYDQVLELARKYPREAALVRGDVEGASLALDEVRGAMANEARAAATQTSVHRDEALLMREAATRWTTATQKAATRAAPGETVVIDGVVVKRGRNRPPTVKLLGPEDGALFTAPAEILLSAEAHDPDGKVARVDYYIGQKLIASVTESPFVFKWEKVPEGRYRVTAKAFDDSGDSTSSETAEVTVIRAKP